MVLRNILVEEGLLKRGSVHPIVVIEQMVGKPVSPGDRVLIQGYPVDVFDSYGSLELEAVDEDASRALLRFFRSKGLSVKYSKSDNRIRFSE